MRLLDLAIQQERCYRGAGWKEEEEGRTGKREDGKGNCLNHGLNGLRRFHGLKSLERFV